VYEKLLAAELYSSFSRLMEEFSAHAIGTEQQSARDLRGNPVPTIFATQYDRPTTPCMSPLRLYTR
jgi:hypothetical protein